MTGCWVGTPGVGVVEDGGALGAGEALSVGLREEITLGAFGEREVLGLFAEGPRLPPPEPSLVVVEFAE